MKNHEIIIGEYREGDIDELLANLREHDRVMMESYGGVDGEGGRAFIEKLLKSGCSYTSTFTDKEGKLVALWLVMSRCEGVACVFSYMTTRVDEHPLAFVKASRRGIDIIQKALKLHRLECTCDSEYEKSMRWLEAMGFEVEAVMRCNTPNKRDQLLMARIF